MCMSSTICELLCVLFQCRVFFYFCVCLVCITGPAISKSITQLLVCDFYGFSLWFKCSYQSGLCELLAYYREIVRAIE